MKTFFLSTLTSIILGFQLSAAVETGAAAPDFTLPAASGDTITLSEHTGKIVVLEWLNHGCPFVVRHYKDGNMQALQDRVVSDGGVWLSIISSAPGKQGYSTPDEATADREKVGSKASFILIDEDGTVGKAYAARTTPHLYVINAEGTLVYQGAIDDRPRGPASEATNYVVAALDAMGAGKPVSNGTTKPYGCSVKY